MNPDMLQPGERARVDVQPQLRGPAGARRPHAPRLPAGRSRHRDHRPPVLTRRPGGLGHAAVHRRHRTAVPLRRSRRRHRPDHPERLAQARSSAPASAPGSSANGAKTRRSSSTSRSTPARPSSSQAPTSAPARRESTPSGRWRTTASASSSRRGSPTSSATTARRSACCPCSCPTRRSSLLLSRDRGRPALEVTVDLEVARAARRRRRRALRRRRLHPLAADGRSRRHRPDAAQRRRHHDVRDNAPDLEATRRLSVHNDGVTADERRALRMPVATTARDAPPCRVTGHRRRHQRRRRTSAHRHHQRVEARSASRVRATRRTRRRTRRRQLPVRRRELTSPESLMRQRFFGCCLAARTTARQRDPSISGRPSAISLATQGEMRRG